jgi:PhzF family phenazine biosynthesis protein
MNEGASVLRTRAYKVVDVFTSCPLQGNPVAVVLDAEGLDTQAMQSIARWTNLSETTFLLPPTRPEAQYRLRIFTPQSELPFAGHPTLGSAFAVLEKGVVQPKNDLLVQECGVGLVTLSVRSTGLQRHISFELPPAKFTSLSPTDIAELEAILGQDVVKSAGAGIVNVGAVWVVAQIASVEKLLALSPDFNRSAEFERRMGATGLSVFARYEGGDKAIEVRSFAPSCGVNEDPVCGSGNGSIAVFLRERGLLPATGNRYVAGQGQCVARDGRVMVGVNDDGITVGGSCVTCVDGTLIL